MLEKMLAEVSETEETVKKEIEEEVNTVLRKLIVKDILKYRENKNFADWKKYFAVDEIEEEFNEVVDLAELRRELRKEIIAGRKIERYEELEVAKEIACMIKRIVRNSIVEIAKEYCTVLNDNVF